MLEELDLSSADRSPRRFQTSDRPIRVLAVDDDRVGLMYLERQIRDLGYETATAGHGQAAWERLDSDPDGIDVMVLDREMPVLDGMALARRVQGDARLRRTPIIMLTGADRPEQMREGIDAGVFYYLTKPLDAVLLRSVLNAATRQVEKQRILRSELQQQRRGFELIQTCKFTLRSLDEAELLSVFMANCFPDPERTLPGLVALLTNAVEHGSAGIGYDAKTDLLNSGTWREVVERRIENAADKTVDAVLARKTDGIYVVITDQGEGFRWQEFLNIDPSRAGDNHGRGIAQARMLSFDKLTYNAKGNQVVGFVRHQQDLDW
ncbi:MAG: response regulator [Alphaproteobacteria bacterium]